MGRKSKVHGAQVLRSGAKHKLKSKVKSESEIIDQMDKVEKKKRKHGKWSYSLKYAQLQCWMPSRCAENSATEEGCQCTVFKLTVEKESRENTALHIRFPRNQWSQMFK